MKSRTEIEAKIKILEDEIDQLAINRNNAKNEFGGISEEENEDYFADVNYKNAEIKIMKWILKD